VESHTEAALVVRRHELLRSRDTGMPAVRALVNREFGIAVKATNGAI